MIAADQRFMPMQALKAMTINVTHHYVEQASKVWLEAGKLASRAILDQNPSSRQPPFWLDRRMVDGTPGAGHRTTVAALSAIEAILSSHGVGEKPGQVKINPLLVCRAGEGVVAVDALICFAP